MDPFKPNPEWYQQYWYSPRATKSSWRVPAALGTLAGIVISLWL
jgi:hypothetical protein